MNEGKMKKEGNVKIKEKKERGKSRNTGESKGKKGAKDRG